MASRRFLNCAIVVLLSSSIPALADDPVAVDALTFVRAESDQYFARYAAQGAFGKFIHLREPVKIDQQDVIRMNRDTLYSIGVFDLSHPVTIHKPDPIGRFQSILAINQDHYVVGIEHDGGNFQFTQDEVGTRYLIVFFRTFMDPSDPSDIDAANVLQDAITVEQSEPGNFDVPNWDEVSLDRTRGLLNALAADYRGSSNQTFGSKDEVDPIKHLIGSAAGWAGNPEKAALYEGVYPEQDDGDVPHVLTVSDAPVDGFWSLTVYNEDGYMQRNEDDAYSVNNVTAQHNTEGSVTVHFGGCEDARVNCLPIMKGWSYVVRMYQPQAEILEGRWSFPKAKPTK